MTLPLRTRLTAVYCTVFCLSTILLESGAYIGLQSGINSLVDRELQARTNGIVDFIDHHVAKMPLGRFQEELAAHGALQPEFLNIKNSEGRDLWNPEQMKAAGGDASQGPTAWTQQSAAGLPIRVRRSDVEIKGERYSLHVATDLSIPFEILRRFRLFVILSLPLVFAGASVIGYWISGRALLPVSEMSAAARAIGAANLADRLNVPQSGDELQRLGETLNGMLARIEDAFRHVTQFTANASHELRTPLAVIRTTAEVALLRVRPSIGTYREALLRILEESEKNTILLDDMLHLARADSSERALPLQPIDLALNLKETCDQLMPLAEDRGLSLRLSLPPGSLVADWVGVRADNDHLRRLWLILLDNAIKYTQPGGEIDIVLSVTREQAICEVKDTGIGISPLDLPHIFERFYRSGKARKREQGGAGLGLSIAQWIVNAHHARIEVDSTLGAGSTFRVRLPRVQREPEAAQRKGPSPAVASETVS